MQQAVDSTQVDERTEVGDVLDHSGADLANLDLAEQRLLLFRAFVFDELTTRHHDVAAGIVDLEDDALDFAVDVVLDIGRATDIDLAGWQEHVHADVDEQPAFDLAEDLPLDAVAFLVRRDDPFPVALPLGLAPGKLDQTLLVFDFFEQDFNLLAGFRRRFRRIPFIGGDDPLAFVTDIDEHIVAFATQHDAGDDLPGVERLGRFVVHLLDRGEFFRGEEGAERRVEFILRDKEFTQQISIDHACFRFAFQPTPPS